MDYEKDINIDSEALDLEWINQPSLMYKYSEHAAITKHEMDRTKERMEIVKADLDSQIRNNPKDFGLPKVTESAIQGAVTLQPKYKKAVEQYHEVKYEYGVAMAAVNAIDQRKSALENLVKLLCASYFAGPQTPRDLSKEYLAKKEQTQSNAKVKIKRRKKNEKKEEV